MTDFHRIACDLLALRVEPVICGPFTPIVWVDTPDGPIFFATI